MTIPYSVKKGWRGKQSVLYRCPTCTVELESSIEDADTEEKCPECGHSYTVPGFDEYTAIKFAAIKIAELKRAEQERSREAREKQHKLDEQDRAAWERQAKIKAEAAQRRAREDHPEPPPEEEPIRCPSCRSTQLSANKKGFGLGKAVAGGLLLGPLGLLGGLHGSGKLKITCLKCGHIFEPGQA